MKFIVYSPFINIDQYGVPSFTKVAVITAADVPSALLHAKKVGYVAPIIQPAVTLN